MKVYEDWCIFKFCINYQLKYLLQIMVFELYYEIIISHSGLDFMRMPRNIDFQIYEMSLVERRYILRRNIFI